MSKYLDENGLRQLWTRIGEVFARKSEIPVVPDIPDISGIEKDVDDIKDRIDGVDDNLSELTESVDSATSEVAKKITKPDEAATVGKILKVKSVNADGTFVCEWADGGIDRITVEASDGDIRIHNGAYVPQSTTGAFGTSKFGQCTFA